MGNTWLVHETIREVNICSHDPDSLPKLSMIKSEEPEWYFLSPEEYTSPKKTVRKRTTPSGFWKVTGRDRKVRKDNRRNGVVIGTKRSLVYHEGKSSNGIRTPWTMHEYEITCLPLVVERPYVICKIFYKGNVGDIPSYSNSSEPSQSLVTDDSNTVGVANTPPPWDALYPIPNTLFIDNNDNNPNMQLQAPCLGQDDIEFLAGMKHVHRELVEFLFIDDQEFITQEKCEEYMRQLSCLF